MKIESLWNENGGYFTKKSKGFHARSTGCSCCSIELFSEKEIKDACIDNLEEVMVAVKYFKWKDFHKMILQAKKTAKDRFR